MAWNDPLRSNEYKVTMLKINGEEVGQLNGFVSGSVTYRYETDLRRIAKISTQDDNYIDNTLLKIEVIASTGNTEVLGVFCVQDIQMQETATSVIKDYDLASIAYKLKTSYTTTNYHFTGNVQLSKILQVVNDGCVEVKCEGTSTYSHNYGSDGWVIDAGTCRLDILNTICSDYNVRYQPNDFDIKVVQYIRPSTKPAIFEMTKDNSTISGAITYEDTGLTAINRAIVKYNGNSNTIVGVATASSSSPVAPAKRGQYVCQVFDLHSLNPETQSQADKVARQKLDDSMPTETYKVKGIYLGAHDGDVGTIEVDGENKKVMVHDLDIDLRSPAMLCDYQLKAVNSD